MKANWQVQWRLLTRDKRTRMVTKNEIIITEPQNKLLALNRYFYMMLGLPKSKEFNICELKVLKNGVDVTSSINKWLNSDRVC